MKIFKNIILLMIFFSYYFINTVYATNEGIVTISSNKEVVDINEEIEVTVNINTLTAAYTLYIEFDDTKLDYISGSENTNVVGNRIIHLWYDETGGNGKKGEVGKFKFKSKEAGKTKISINGDFYNEHGESIQTNFNECIIEIKTAEGMLELNSSKLNLENLAVENILLYPPFDSYILNYDIEISNNINDINILAIPENEQSRVNIMGNTDLKEGENKIIVTVLDINGEKREYTINAYKRNQLEEQAYIENKEKEREELKEIYEIQQLSNSNLKNDEHQVTQNNYIRWIVTIILIMGIIVILKRAIEK